MFMADGAVEKGDIKGTGTLRLTACSTDMPTI